MNFNEWPFLLQLSVIAGVSLLALLLLLMIISQLNLRAFYQRHLKVRVDRIFYLTLDIKKELAVFEHHFASVQKTIQFSFADMQKALSEKHWQALQEWMGKAQQNALKANDSLSIFFKWKNRQLRNWIRIGYYNYDSSNLRIKCSAENLFGSRTSFYAVDPKQLTDLLEFGNELNDLQRLHPHAGVLLNLYNPQIAILHQHYGNEIANHYMMTVWTDLDKLVTKNRLVSYQFGGHYLIYSHEGTSDHHIHELLNTVIQRTRKEFEMDRYRFAVTFQVGVMRVNAPIESLTEVLNQLHVASRSAKTLAYPITYVNFDSINEAHLSQEQKINEFKSLLEKKTYKMTFDAVYSIPSGTVHGYQMKISALFAEQDTDINKLYHLADQFHLEKEFIASLFGDILARFARTNFEPRHLFIPLPTSVLEEYSGWLKSNPLGVKITLLCDDVPSFEPLYRSRKIDGIMEDFENRSIRICAKATPELGTSYYPYSHIFSYLRIDDIAEGVETNVQRQWTIQSITTSLKDHHILSYVSIVKSYEQAETLRNLGVGIQGGEFFNQLSGKKYSSAIRKFQRLLDIEGGE